MQFDILTLFPDLIHFYSEESILGRAQQKGLIDILAHNFRDDTRDKQKHVDDRPYGGGPGMILQVQPIYDCLKRINALKSKNKKTKILLMDPAGKKFDQRMAEKFSKLDRLVLICGRYEGFDARIHKFVDERISVGDYVLAGGELPTLTIVEAVSRLVPGVLGNEESLAIETFGRGQMSKVKGQKSPLEGGEGGVHGLQEKEFPQYTRPEEFMGWKVPKVLLSGDHKKIEEWRTKQSKKFS